MRHRPGQYLTFALDQVPGRRPAQAQLLDLLRPGQPRLPHQRQARGPAGRRRPGIASNWLHDRAGPGTVLKVAPPAGEFFLDEKDDGPVVLLSGGVGLTPMMSMLESIVRSGSGRPVWYVHGAENGRVHAMGEHARELAAQAPNVTVRTFYNVPAPGDVAGRDYDERGLISADWLPATRLRRTRPTTFAARGRSCARWSAAWRGRACLWTTSATSSSGPPTSCWPPRCRRDSRPTP